MRSLMTSIMHTSQRLNTRFSHPISVILLLSARSLISSVELIMQIFKNLEEWQAHRKTLSNTLSIGFVPTMGNLHAGHASLFKKSQQDNTITIASIFINPTQFNQENDFKHYPRTLEQDVALLSNLGVDYCLLPDEKAMYSDGYRYQIDEKQLTQIMEGKHRAHHFTGVLTIVMKLFNLTKPNRAYLGEKDYQQFELIRDMSTAFFMNIEVIACPTVREASGLAYSSRNGRLNAEQRTLAEQFARIFHQPIPIEKIIHELKDMGIRIDYVEEHQRRRYAAVHIGDIRLIDNYLS